VLCERLKKTPREIGRMTFPEANRLLRYWSRNGKPPPDTDALEEELLSSPGFSRATPEEEAAIRETMKGF
jgi:hypothetical protein